MADESLTRARKRANWRAWKERVNADPEKRAAFLQATAESNKRCADKRRAYNAEWYRQNAEQVSANFKAYYQQNRERYAAHTRRRQARLMQRTPAWLTDADFDAMTAIYAEAKRLTLETGMPHEVDHIIPLQGRMVSGLHVPSNLQILTESQNRSKGHKHGV